MKGTSPSAGKGKNNRNMNYVKKNNSVHQNRNKGYKEKEKRGLSTA
jgi:hypothetical protein